MGFEDAGGRKLTQLMTYHVFRNKNRDEGFAVVNSEGLTDKVRSNHGATAPGFNWLLVAGFDRSIDLGKKLLINVWAFFSVNVP